MENKALCYRSFGEPEHTLSLETTIKAPLERDHIRVAMLCAPVNASDLIPVTGAYRHRITLPSVAGYEGVGIVIDAAAGWHHLLGQRVLPLRGEGTWQRYVDCPAALAIHVPEMVPTTLAARAFINPLAARLMIEHFSPAGKRVLLTAAGSGCARLLGEWALKAGALSVAGIHRSPVHATALAASGITPVPDSNRAAVQHYAADADIVYDATGGSLAMQILDVMQPCGQFISYGLLSGQAFHLRQALPKVHWFHVRNYLPSMSVAEWQNIFLTLWPALTAGPCREVKGFALHEWPADIAAWRSAGRTFKPVIWIDACQA